MKFLEKPHSGTHDVLQMWGVEKIDKERDKERQGETAYLFVFMFSYIGTLAECWLFWVRRKQEPAKVAIYNVRAFPFAKG